MLANENLLRQGYETYLPLVQIQRRRNRRYQNLTEAYFPRYLFIHLDTENDNWSSIRSTIGVSGLIRFGGFPAIVPEYLIKNLKNNEDENGKQKVEVRKLKSGDSVCITDGPFAGYQGIYQQSHNLEQVSILLDIVGKNTQVTLSVNELQLAEH